MSVSSIASLETDALAKKFQIKKKQKHKTKTKILLDAGAKVNEEDKNGATALALAAYFGSLPVVKELVKNNANIQNIDYFGKTALQRAEDRGHTENS